MDMLWKGFPQKCEDLLIPTHHFVKTRFMVELFGGKERGRQTEDHSRKTGNFG